MYLSMFLFLLPSNIEQMCLKVLFQMPGEITKTGTDKLDLSKLLSPFYTSPSGRHILCYFRQQAKNAVLPEERDMKNTEMPTAIIYFQ